MWNWFLRQPLAYKAKVVSISLAMALAVVLIVGGILVHDPMVFISGLALNVAAGKAAKVFL